MMQLGFMWIIVQCVTGIMKVVSTSFTQTTSFIDRQGWQISNQYFQGYSLCRDVQLFGGNHEFDMSTAINKLFNLEPHYKLYLSFVVYIIDMSSPQAINVIVDQLPHQFIIPVGSNDQCGQSQVENSQNITLNLSHSYPTAIISIFSSIDSTSVYWGIRDFKLSVDTCPLGCQICFQESQVFECSQWKLFHESWMSKDLRDFNDDGWQVTSVSGSTDCASIAMYGGYHSMTVSGAIQKTFRLGPHSNLFFIYRFIKIDGWTGEYGTFKIGNTNYQMLYNGGGIQKNYCGDPSYPDQFHIHGIEYNHDGEFVTVLITSDQYNIQRYYGIRDFQIYGYTTPSYCGDGIIDDNEQCDDGNIFGFDGCFNCQYYCVEGCSNCIAGICLNCQEGWVFDILNDQCIYQQFKLLDEQVKYEIVQIEEDINMLIIKEKNCIEFIYQNQCIKCKKGYYLDSQGICQTLCGDQIVAGNEECEIGIQKNCNKNCQYECQEECTLCIFGKCNQCRYGFVLQNNKCIEKCGDWWIQREEECDDGNMVRFDGCHNCQNECQDQCLDCEYGQCMRCKDSWILINGNCEFRCGDSIISQGVEECDDGNDIQFDGCYNCKLECADQGCSACYLGICYNCIHPLTLYKDQCLVICGDGLLAQGFEDCDDGNDIPYDGCYKCKYQCYKECKICDRGICIDECDYGYYLINQVCIPLCGDGIITIDEECDDDNSIEFDGCYQCNYSCPQNCQICDEGICHKCNFGYYLIDQMCINKCGDGFVAFPIEECDDLNLNNQDGCNSNCIIEIDWHCTQPSEDSFTQCQYIVAPAIQLNYISEEYEIQYIQLTFTQNVKTDQLNYTSYINTTILNFSIDAYQVNIIEIIPANSILQSVRYLFKIVILQTTQNDLIFQVNLNQQLYNHIELPLQQLQSSIKLNQPKLLNKNQLTVSSQIQTINKIILYFSCGVGLIYLLLGKVGVFLDILDILQQQSYLKFINIQIPQNLKIYYESSNAISFQPLLQFLDLNTISSNYVQLEYIEAKYKFKEYEINADVAANLQLFLIMITIILISRIFCKYILQILYKINIPMLWQFQFKLHCSVTIIFSKLYFNFAKQGFQVIIYSNSFDLLFISCIQLSVICDLYRKLFSISIIVFTTLVIIQPKKNRQQNSIIIIKKFAYILTLVFYQSCQIIQSILLALIQTFYMTYLISQQKGMSLQFFKQIAAEASILLTIIMNFCYWEELINSINYQNKINISWSQIALLSSSLATLVIIEAYISLNNIYKKILEKIKRKPCRAQFPFEQMIV